MMAGHVGMVPDAPKRAERVVKGPSRNARDSETVTGKMTKGMRLGTPQSEFIGHISFAHSARKPVSCRAQPSCQVKARARGDPYQIVKLEKSFEPGRIKAATHTQYTGSGSVYAHKATESPEFKPAECERSPANANGFPNKGASSLS
jgi:hypothetical protein